MTGDSQWEYPSDETGTDVKKDTSSLEAPVQSSTAATVTSDQSLAVWSFPSKEFLLLRNGCRTLKKLMYCYQVWTLQSLTILPIINDCFFWVCYYPFGVSTAHKARTCLYPLDWILSSLSFEVSFKFDVVLYMAKNDLVYQNKDPGLSCEAWNSVIWMYFLTFHTIQ